MNIDREFTVFENDFDWRKRKRLQLLEVDDFRRAKFTRADRWVNVIKVENLESEIIGILRTIISSKSLFGGRIGL